MNELMEINKMPDIDSLSIRLTSSSTDAVKAINSVIDSLARLNGALNNYTDDSKFVKGMGSLTGGLKGIASSINSIDLEKLKNLSTTLDKLGVAGEKLVKLNFIQSFSELGAQSQRVNQFLSNTAKSMAEDFKLPKGQVDNLTVALRKLYDANGDSSKIKQAKNEIRDLVSQFGKSKKEATDWANEIKRQLRKSTIYLPEQLKGDWGEEFNKNKAILGIGNTTTDITKGTSLEKIAEEFNQIAGTTFTLDQGITACANSMIRFLQEPDASVMASYQSQMDALDAALERLTGDFAKATMTKQASDNEFASVPTSGSSFMEDATQDAQQAAVALNNATAATSALKAQLNTELQNPFEGLVKGIEALNQVNLPAEKFTGITQLASTIGKFGSVNSEKAITNIPRFTKAFAEMATQLASAPQISDNLVRLAEAMSKFSARTDTASKTTTKFSKTSQILGRAFSSMYPHTMRAHRGFTSLAAVFGRLYANFFLVIRAARALGKAIDYSSSMTEAQNVVAVTFGRNSEVMDKFAESAIKDFGMAKLSATQFASRFQAMGSTMGITADKVAKANEFIKEKVSGNSRAYEDLGDSVADMSINLTKLTADMASLYNQDYEDVAQDMQAIYTGMTRPLRKYGLDLTQATLKEWALANGLDADIDKMSQAEKTMLRYQYVMSRAGGAMGDFTKTADTWANAMRTVKQLLQEIARLIGEAFINALRPALLQFRNFLFNFLELTQNALNALGKLLGWKQINFASATLVDDTEDYADALDDAAGAAKKLKGQLRGIDELNNLTTNDKNGGSGSGLSGLAASIDDLINDAEEGEIPYESAIKSWYEFGQKIANAIKNGLTDIDWDSIKEKGRNFATNLASWLNGLIQPDMFFQIGSTIGNAVMTAIETIGVFADEADWEKWGASIAAGVNGFFDKFEGDKAAETINKLADGLKRLFTEALNRIHWDEVFGDIKDFAKGIEINTIDFVFTASAIAMAGPAVAGLIASAAMANPVVIPALALSITGGYLVGKGINKILEEALGENEVTGEKRYSEMWGDLYFSKWDDMLHAKDLATGKRDPRNYTFKLASASGKWTAGLLKGKSSDELLNSFMDDMGVREKTGKKWWQNPLEAGTKAIFSEKNLETLNIITAGLTGLVKGVKDLKDSLVETWDTLIGWFDYWDEHFDPMREDLSDILDKIGGVGDKFDDLVGEIFGPAEEKIEKWADNLFDNGLDIENKAFEWAGTVKDRLLEGMTLDEILLDDTVGKIFPYIEEKATNFGEWIDNFFNNNILPWFTKEKWHEILQPIRDQLKYAFQAGANFAVGALNKVLEGLEKMMNGAGDLFNALIDLASKILQKDLEKWGRISLPRIATPYANGGYPQVGSLFLAGEAGSEMVGTINGKTGVVSNGEITGIADAIRSTSDTEIQLLRQQNTLLQGILNKEFGISSDNIFNSVRNSAREYTNMTGQPAW